MVGALISAVLVWRFASEAKGHGVPQVLKALIQRNGTIQPRVGIVKVFASIATVGSGGSAGTEGPIVQIGATAGSVLAHRLNIPREHVRTLVGCGAAAGIAATGAAAAPAEVAPSAGTAFGATRSSASSRREEPAAPPASDPSGSYLESL